MFSVLTDCISLFSLLLWGFWLCRKLQLPHAFGPAMGVCSAIVFLTFSGTLNLLWPGAWIFFLVSFLLFFFDRKQWQYFPAYLTSSAVLGFLFACLALEIVYAIKDPGYCQWDELSHWGIFYKCVYFFHQFHVYVPGDTFVHPAYPQGAAALYAFFAILKGSFQERDTFFSLNLLLFSAAATLFFALDKKVTRKIQKAGLVFLGLLVIPVVFGPFVYQDAKAYVTVYMDAPMGAIFIIGLALLLLEHSSPLRQSLAIAIACGANICLKDMGILCSLCILGAWFLVCLFRSKKFLQAGKYLLVAGAGSLIQFILWKLVLVMQGCDNDSYTQMTGFLDKWKAAANGSDSFFFEAWNAFVDAFVHRPLLYGQGSLTFFCLCTLLSWGICLLLFLRKQNWNLFFINLLMPLYFLLYAGSLFYVYICGMSKAEALRVACYDRYISSFLMGWLFLVFVSWLLARDLLPRVPGYAVSVAIPLLLVVNSIVTVSANGLTTLSFGTVQWRSDEIAISEALLQQVGSASGNGVLLSAKDPWPRAYYYRYELWPQVRIQVVTIPVEQDACDLQTVLEENTIDYLFIFGATPDFKANYADSFSDGLVQAEQTPTLPVPYHVIENEAQDFSFEKIDYTVPNNG